MPNRDVWTPAVRTYDDRFHASREIVRDDYNHELATWGYRKFQIKVVAGVRAAEELDRIVDEHHCTYREGKKIE